MYISHLITLAWSICAEKPCFLDVVLIGVFGMRTLSAVVYILVYVVFLPEILTHSLPEISLFQNDITLRVYG